MMNYYNEFDHYKAEQLRSLIARKLIPDGVVDERDIKDVKPEELRGFTQCHFFAGIGGWPLALRLAGWPEDRKIWTASCPCQPYSRAGKMRGASDTRDLWPILFDLYREHKEVPMVGEQVESSIKFGWLDRVCTNMEAIGHTVGACVVGSHSIGKDHIRQRIYFFANSAEHGCEGLLREAEAQISKDRPLKALGAWNGISHPFCNWRKLLAEPHVVRMAHGIPSTLDIRPRLHAYGDAIDPQLAAEFIRAIM